MLHVFAYAIAVAAALSVVGICAERLAALHRLPRRTAWAAAMLSSLLLPAGMILLAPPAEIRNVRDAVADQYVPHIDPELPGFAEATDEKLPAQALPSVQSVPAMPSTSVAPPLTWRLQPPSDKLLIAMWIATSTALALYLLGANILLLRRMKGWRPATMQDQEVLISEVTGPALLGAVSPRIVVPRWLLLQPQGTQALILEHERQHMLARDALLIMAGLVAIVAAPWNLPLWWQWRRMRQAIELDCDARVLGTGADANAYAEVLLAVTQRSRRIPAGVLAMTEPVHSLERRIANLLPDGTRYARLQAISVLLLAAAGAGATLALEAPALPGRSAAAPVVESAPAVRTQAPVELAMEPASFTAGEYIVAAVRRGDIEDLVTSTGTMTPRDSVDVVAQVSGRIEKLHVEVGDRVNQGDVLAKFDAATAKDKVNGLRAQLLNAETTLEIQKTNLAMAERDYRRQENLAADDATTQEARHDGEATLRNAERAVISARAQIEALKANLRIEERNLGYTMIVAPIAGTVMKVQVRQGQTINATQDTPVILQIANLSTMTVVADVSEADVTRLHDGIAVYFTTLGIDSRRWYSKLKRIEPTPKTRNGAVVYPALFDVQNDGSILMPQMTVSVSFVIAEARNVLLVPTAALRQGGGGSSGEHPIVGQIGAGTRGSAAQGKQRRNGTVMVKKADGTLEARPVVLGVTDRVHSEVLEGLEEGEEVVVGRRGAETAVAPSGD